MPQLKVGLCPGATPKVVETLHDNGIKSVADFISEDIEDLAAKYVLPYQMPQLKVGLCPGATPKVVETLHDNGIKSVADFISADIEDLAAKYVLPYQDLLAIRRVLLAQYSAFPMTGADAYTRLLTSVTILSTGCNSLDQMLDGGIYTAEMTELAGVIAAGKTQVCFSTSAMVAMEAQQHVLYIDTCGSFSAERFEEILEERGCKDIQRALMSIRCMRIFDIFRLLELLEDTKSCLLRKLDEFYSSLRLIIVDSIAAVVSPVLGGQQTDGHSLMCCLALKLKLLASEFSLAVLVTNNTVGNDPSHPTVALGRSWHHTPHTRVLLQTITNTPQDVTRRKATLVKSSRLAVNSSVQFGLSTRGPVDLS